MLGRWPYRGGVDIDRRKSSLDDLCSLEILFPSVFKRRSMQVRTPLLGLSRAFAIRKICIFICCCQRSLLRLERRIDSFPIRMVAVI